MSHSLVEPCYMPPGSSLTSRLQGSGCRAASGSGPTGPGARRMAAILPGPGIRSVTAGPLPGSAAAGPRNFIFKTFKHLHPRLTLQGQSSKIVVRVPRSAQLKQRLRFSGTNLHLIRG
eukprot:765830-Hanusia_phi.AAC.7